MQIKLESEIFQEMCLKNAGKPTFSKLNTILPQELNKNYDGATYHQSLYPTT